MELSIALAMVVAMWHGSLPAGSPHESTSPWMQGQKSDQTVHQASAAACSLDLTCLGATT